MILPKLAIEQINNVKYLWNIKQAKPWHIRYSGYILWALGVAIIVALPYV
jgi:hypothetical protein